MRKPNSYHDLTSSVAWRLAAWGLLGACLAVSLWLAVRSEQKWSAARHAREPFQPSISQAAKAPSSNDDALAGESPSDTRQPSEASNAVESPAAPPAREERSGDRPVVGHHRLGPEQADVQMVMFFDYGSQRCQRIEQEVRTLMRRFARGVSLSLRHFPQSTDCNHTLKLNTHPNACQAARAAETAGILKGEAGFWEMHSWLSQCRGRFSTGELRDALPSLGYNDVDHFLEVMEGAEPLEHVLRDVLDAATLRNVAPGTAVMNGIQLEGDEIEGALAQAARFLEEQPPTGERAASPVETSAERPFSDELVVAALGATVQVVNVSNGDQGSGVMVAKSGSTVYMLTADHLLGSSRPSADYRTAADQNDRLEVRAVSAAGNASVVYRSVRVVARASDADLAVLSFTTRRDVRAPLRICPSQRIPDTETFAVLSAGWSGGGPTSAVGKVTSKKLVRKRSKSAATLVWELNRPSKPGQSGGALVDQEGHVVGVASGNSGGHGYFCHTESIHRLLDENGLNWLCSETPETTESGRSIR
jgi:S1-C subfamily serine protease/protein-disulfide isomerase